MSWGLQNYNILVTYVTTTCLGSLQLKKSLLTSNSKPIHLKFARIFQWDWALWSDETKINLFWKNTRGGFGMDRNLAM